jgi:hypothetical protein
LGIVFPVGPFCTILAGCDRANKKEEIKKEGALTAPKT